MSEVRSRLCRKLKRRQGRHGDISHLDEVFIRNNGQQQYLWGAVVYGWPSADVFFEDWHRSGFRPLSVLVLIKARWGLGYFTRAQHEQAYLLAKGQPKKPEAAISDVLIWEDIAQQLHPNQKPLGVISRLVSTFKVRRDRLGGLLKYYGHAACIFWPYGLAIGDYSHSGLWCNSVLLWKSTNCLLDFRGGSDLRGQCGLPEFRHPGRSTA